MKDEENVGTTMRVNFAVKAVAPWVVHIKHPGVWLLCLRATADMMSYCSVAAH